MFLYGFKIHAHHAIQHKNITKYYKNHYFKNKIAHMNDQSDHFPVLGIQEFNQGTPADCDLLFHELHGERSIDSP